MLMFPHNSPQLNSYLFLPSLIIVIPNSLICLIFLSPHVSHMIVIVLIKVLIFLLQLDHMGNILLYHLLLILLLKFALRTIPSPSNVLFLTHSIGNPAPNLDYPPPPTINHVTTTHTSTSYSPHQYNTTSNTPPPTIQQFLVLPNLLYIKLIQLHLQFLFHLTTLSLLKLFRQLILTLPQLCQKLKTH